MKRSTLIGSVLRPLIANPQALQTDFHYYYDAARSGSRRSARACICLSDDVIAGFAYPPPAILPFMWLSRLAAGHRAAARSRSRRIWCCSSRCSCGSAVLKRHGFGVDREPRSRSSLIALALGPTYMNAIFGQVNAFVLACAVAFVSFAPTARRGRGCVLALRHWLKVYPIVLAAIGSWDRRTWRALGWTIVAAVAIAVDRAADRAAGGVSQRFSSTCCRRASTRPRFTSRINHWSRSSNDSAIRRRSS